MQNVSLPGLSAMQRCIGFQVMRLKKLSNLLVVRPLQVVRRLLKTMSKKVLIIAYYWPPSGGSGVQRWLKFVKYLPGFGWTPYVFTPENPSFAVRDESLLKDVPPEAEVIKFPIWEPYGAFSRVSSAVGEKKS